MSSYTKLVDWVIEVAVKYSFQALGGLLILFAAWIISRYVATLVSKKLSQSNIDQTIVKFLAQIVRLGILLLGFHQDH